MKLKLAKPEFLTFSELTGRWGNSGEYMHDLIRTGEIVPAIALTDQERYVGGEFRGGYFVGDIENARHYSYSEFYVGTIFGEDDHYENWPQTARIVFCHSPTDECDGGYSFQFVSESPDAGETARWFYLDHGVRIGSVDGERRFRFVWPEIDRFEAENATADGEQIEAAPAAASVCSTALPPVSQESVELRTVRHKPNNRNHVLDAEIATAEKKALNRDDVNSVWAELVKLAEAEKAEKGCLVGVGDGEVKYERNGEIKCFTKKNLRDRMRVAKAG